MKSLAELAQLREKTLAKINLRKEDDSAVRVVVGMATCGIAAGARPVMKALMDEIEKRGVANCTVTQTGCIGVCRLEPIVEVYLPGSEEKITYVKIDPEKAVKIVNDTIVNGKVVNEYTIGAAENK